MRHFCTIGTVFSIEFDLSRLKMQAPPAPTPASRRLRRLILTTAAATVVVDLVNLGYSDDGGFALTVRTIWTLLRALGFLFLLREVRFGRPGARPLGMILCATTVFAVARLVQPRAGGLFPHWQVIAGLVVLTTLCGLIVFQLYRSQAIAAHLTRRSFRRPVPFWALTARVAALAYPPLLLVPCLVAASTLVHHPRLPRDVAAPIVVGWFVLAFVLGIVTSFVSFAVLYDKGWARGTLASISVLVLAVQPALCWFLGGWDSLLRDGAPLVVTALLCLWGLVQAHRTQRL